MKIEYSPLDRRGSADVLLLPVWENTPLDSLFDGGPEFRALAAAKDFKAKLQETYILYREGAKELRILLLGLGKSEKATKESLRRAYAAAVRAAQAKQAKSMHVLFPENEKFSREELLEACAEGIFLTNYAFIRLKHDSLKEGASTLLEKIVFLDIESSYESIFTRAQKIASGVHFVRDLVNSNADDKRAKFFQQLAKDIETSYPQIKTEIFDKKKLEEEKMGLILAVNRGSAHEPSFIICSYHNDSSSNEHVVLVGKGVTYDTGGLNLKTGDNMLSMKCDMAGAATVLGAVRTAAALGLKVNVTAVVPLVENCIDGESYKPGDVYRSYSGKTVEITNTDAEGRLILADALSYASKNLAPTCIIDLASLTGAIVIALGEEMSGLFVNDESLCKRLLSASSTSGELLWRMPVYEDYLESMKSDIADLINSGSRDGSSIKAALFLQEFVDRKIPWAHIDFAGSCYYSKPKHYYTTKATGFGVRLLIEFLQQKETTARV